MPEPAVIPKASAWNRVSEVVRAYEAVPRQERGNRRGGGSSRFHPCRVQQVGGVNGDATHDCTYTYDIYQLDNTTKVNTGTGDGPFTPKNHFRIPNTPMTAGTYGEWFFDNDGTTRILLVYDERPTSWKICET